MTLNNKHSECPEILRRGMADQGIEVTVSTAPHLLWTGYDQGAFTCPHGIRFYLEPTSEQRAQWVRDGVA